MKRQKSEVQRKVHPSKVFSPYRTIGLVSNKVPFAAANLGQSFVVTTVVGRSFQIYDASNLNLLFVSQPQTESDIQCIQSHFHYTFVATKNVLNLYKRAREVASAPLDLEKKEVPRKICVFGEFVVVATSLCIRVFKHTPTTLEHYTTIKLSQLLGPVVDVCHLPTYLNKVVVATESSLVLVNIKTGKIVHTFDETPGIVAVEPSATALDIVAVATANGDVHLFNVRTAVTLFTLKTGETVTSLSFRSDGAQTLGVANSSGDVFFYDLNARRRVHSVRSLHRGPVSKIHFLQSQPICLSAGKDNVLYELAFDPSISTSNTAITPPPRILRQRGGHSKPPSCIAFTDAESHFLLSGSLDQSLWAFSLRKDAQSHEFSQRQQGAVKAKSQMSRGSLGDKFPPIVELAYEANKERQWDNLLTIHKNEPLARSWSAKRGILGSLELPTLDGANAKAVAISRCGNFGFVGSAQGSVAGFNMQSGKLRKRLEAHSAAVTGVFSSATNTHLVTSSLDGTIKFHSFETLECVHTHDCGSPVSRMRYHPGSGLLAVSLDDMSLQVLDLINMRKVRDLRGHGNRITDFDFSPDGRWIISGSLDSTIRTWDIPTGGCIDAVRVGTPVTSLRLSPGGEWMATAHVSGAGVSLWTMRSQFHTISTKLIKDEPLKEVVMPNVSGQGGAGLLDAALEDEPEDFDFEVENWDRPAQIDGLETLSLEPRHKFNMLVNLDTIKQRNKPVEAPKAPEKRPFFLGMPSEEQAMETEEAWTPAPKNGTSQDQFLDLLEQDPVAACNLLASMGPSATDLELRSLQTSELLLFMTALTEQLKKRLNFELVQAWLKMVLEMHGEVFVASEEHKHALEQVLEAQKTEIQRMQDLTRFGAGVLRYLRAL